MIISNVGSAYCNGKGTAGVTISKSDNTIDIYEGHGTTYQSNEYSLLHSPRNWNGNIVYGLMQSEFDYTYDFIDGYLEINGKLFKNN